jgi:hypothetical protein
VSGRQRTLRITPVANKRVLCHAAVAHFVDTPKALDDGEDMFDSRPHHGLRAVEQMNEFLRWTVRLRGRTLRLVVRSAAAGGLRADQLLLRSLGAVAPDLLFLAMR